MSGRLKDWRRVAKRYDRSPVVFRCAIALAALVICWLCVLSLKRFQFMLDRQYPATPSALSGHWRHPCFNENWKRSNRATHRILKMPFRKQKRVPPVGETACFWCQSKATGCKLLCENRNGSGDCQAQTRELIAIIEGAGRLPPTLSTRVHATDAS